MPVKLSNSKYQIKITDINVFKIDNFSSKQSCKCIYLYNSSPSIPIIKNLFVSKMYIISKFAIKVHCASGSNILVNL